MFTDRVTLELRAGKGGDGIIAWRREKYIPKGGPVGGNGGQGGSIVFEADRQVYSLEAYRNRYFVKAEDGQQGGNPCRQGRNGKSLSLKVPLGTLLKDENGNVLHDFAVDGEKLTFCRGGKGGKGNAHFKSAIQRSPYISTPGKRGEEAQIELELKLIADVGLVGFPNAGKSTFLASTTNVKVKVAPYPFTTLRPNLGYAMGEFEEKILIADIPGIIEGAHQNRGLGHEFLRHIERTNLLVFVIDISGMEGRDPQEDFKILREELEAYDPKLLQKPYLVFLNKCDEETAGDNILAFKKSFQGNPEDLLVGSSLTGEGLDQVVLGLKRKLSK